MLTFSPFLCNHEFFIEIYNLQSTTLQTQKKVSEMVPEEGGGNEKREDGQHDEGRMNE